MIRSTWSNFGPPRLTVIEINNILTAQSDMFSIAKIYRQRNLPLECAHWMLHALNVDGGIDSDLIRDQASQLGSLTIIQ